MALPVSVLNLVPVREGFTQREAIIQAADLAAGCEAVGYTRYWIAEHHNMPNIVSSATVLLMQHVLANTARIRVGSGGIMLPNHSPLVVAEQFGTLQTLYPNRVDLGLGRAPGTDMRTAAALRRTGVETAFAFPDDVAQLSRYLGDESAQGSVRAYPGVGSHVPLYILGSSTNSAVLAARLGLPYVFACHFAPQQAEQAVRIYREHFQENASGSEPYFMLCLNVVMAEDDETARYLQTTQMQSFLGIVRNARRPMQQPVDSMAGLWLPQEEAAVKQMTAGSLCGSPQTVLEQLQNWQRTFKADEIMAVSYIYDTGRQLESYRLFKEIADEL